MPASSPDATGCFSQDRLGPASLKRHRKGRSLATGGKSDFWEAVGGRSAVRPSPPRPQPALCQPPARAVTPLSPRRAGAERRTAAAAARGAAVPGADRTHPPLRLSERMTAPALAPCRCSGSSAVQPEVRQPRHETVGRRTPELRWGERCGQAEPSDGRLALTSAA